MKYLHPYSLTQLSHHLYTLVAFRYSNCHDLLGIFCATIKLSELYCNFLNPVFFPVVSSQALPGDSSWVSQWASIAANHTRTDPEGSGAETGSFLHKERGRYYWKLRF